MALILGVTVLLMVVGNLLVIASLVKFRNLRSVSNFLIGNLAASDFLLAVTILPLSIANECLGRWVGFAGVAAAANAAVVAVAASAAVVASAASSAVVAAAASAVVSVAATSG